jgi:hypothetical protein
VVNTLTKLCEVCGRNITTNNFERHIVSCGVKKPPKQEKKIRGIDFDPNWGYANGTRVAWNKGLTKETNEILLQQSEVRKREYRAGIRKLSGAALTSSEERSIRAKRNKTGGYKPNAGRSKKYNVVDSFGNHVVLQSSYEMDCAILLGQMGIEWMRPRALKYDGRNYFADFYLPGKNIYLDPKNDYKAKLDKEKIQKVVEQNDVKVFILTKDKITKEYLSTLVGPDGEGIG